MPPFGPDGRNCLPSPGQFGVPGCRAATSTAPPLAGVVTGAVSGEPGPQVIRRHPFQPPFHEGRNADFVQDGLPDRGNLRRVRIASRRLQRTTAAVCPNSSCFASSVTVGTVLMAAPRS